MATTKVSVNVNKLIFLMCPPYVGYPLLKRSLPEHRSTREDSEVFSPLDVLPVNGV